ncbi:MAG: hypothetical protein IKR59_01535 [Lachnospiraceae bacterium]|nr:hypothetical protein [Lachnospiraceae bacterium]
MEIIEEEQPLGSVGRTQRITISRRDTLVNDLKNSTVQGLISFLVSIIGAVTILAGFYLSFRASGQGSVLVGLLMIAAFVLSVSAVVIGIFGLRNRKKIRHYMEKRGIVIGIICIAGLITLYVRGILIYLAH